MSSTDRPASPTAEERERKDAEDRKREKEEQDALPYKWTQTLTEADVVIPIAGNYKARDLVVEIKKNSLRVGIKGQEPLLEGPTPHHLLLDDSTWTLEPTPTGKEIHLNIAKSPGSNWWAHIVTTAPAIDTSKIEPENSKLSDLDGETRGMVEKMMYDQEMKRQGKPTSEEAKKNDLLQKFMKEHPEMDFSKAKIG